MTPPTAKPKTLIPIRSIRILQAEGATPLPAAVIHASFAEANTHLAHICAAAPKVDGSWKVDFLITYKDGNTYVGGFSATSPEHRSHIVADLREHVRNNLLYMAGLRRPAHMAEEQYAAFLKADAGRIAKSTKHLTTYMLDDAPEDAVLIPVDVSENLSMVGEVIAGMIRSLEEDASILQRNDATHTANLQNKRAFELRKALAFVSKAQDVK